MSKKSLNRLHVIRNIDQGLMRQPTRKHGFNTGSRSTAPRADPHIQRRDDGTWILVRGRSAAGGGYVAVYYTIIGGAVNLASRLESAAQPGTILISHETYSLVHNEFHCLEHQTIRLKGMAYPVKTYVAVNSHAALGTQSGHIFEHRANLLLDADLNAMDRKERSQVVTTLLRQLEQEDECSWGNWIRLLAPA